MTEPDVIWDPLSGGPVRIDSVWPGYVMLLNFLRVVRFDDMTLPLPKVVRFEHELWATSQGPANSVQMRKKRPDGRSPNVPFPSWYATDDLGTEYEDQGGAHGDPATGPVLEGEWDIVPVPPAEARWFDLTFTDYDESSKRRLASFTIRMYLPLPETTF